MNKEIMAKHGFPTISQPQNSDTLTINDEGIAMSIKKDKEHLETAKDLIELYLKKVDDGKKASKNEEGENMKLTIQTTNKATEVRLHKAKEHGITSRYKHGS